MRRAVRLGIHIRLADQLQVFYRSCQESRVCVGREQDRLGGFAVRQMHNLVAGTGPREGIHDRHDNRFSRGPACGRFLRSPA
jgi:hypothetical protein